MADKGMARYWRLKSAGLCVSCGSAPAVEGRTRCQAERDKSHSATARAYFSKWQREKRRKNPAWAKARDDKFRLKYKDRTAMRIKRQWPIWKATPEYRRRYGKTQRRLDYGLEPEQYDAMVLRAAGHCECCGKKDEGTRATGLVVDHDHASGRVRALVCHRCNQYLASGEIDYLLAYLRKFSGKAFVA